MTKKSWLLQIDKLGVYICKQVTISDRVPSYSHIQRTATGGWFMYTTDNIADAEHLLYKRAKHDITNQITYYTNLLAKLS